jgi:hypothetical protein
MSSGRRGGERRRLTLSKREHRTRGARKAPPPRDASFARSRDPCTFTSRGARRRRRVRRGAPSEASRLGKPAQAGGTSTGVVEGGRRAARRAPPLRKERRGASEKEDGRGHRPCEDQEPGFGCPHVESTQLQKSSGGVWPRISSVFAPKNGAGASERGPSLGRRAAGNTVVRRQKRSVRRGFGVTRVSG